MDIPQLRTSHDAFCLHQFKPPMSERDDYDRRLHRKRREHSRERRDSGYQYGREDGEHPHRRRTEEYGRHRSRSVEGRVSPRKRSRSPYRRGHGSMVDEIRERPDKRRRPFDDRDRPRITHDERDTIEDKRSLPRRRSRERIEEEVSSRHSHHRRPHRDREGSRSPRRHHRRSRPRSISHSPPPISRRSKAPLPSQQDAFTSNNNGKQTNAIGDPIEKQKPNYGASGKLAAETNTVAGTDIILKYNEPPEARKPSAAQQWRMYEFKGSNPDPLSTTELHTRSCWLFGRETAVVDFPIEHPSCSKQHAVIQFRYVEKRSEFGDKIGGVKPYIIDLESANGTKLNGERIQDKRFLEIKNGDMLGFGESTREYVVMLPPKE